MNPKKQFITLIWAGVVMLVMFIGFTSDLAAWGTLAFSGDDAETGPSRSLALVTLVGGGDQMPSLRRLVGSLQQNSPEATLLVFGQGMSHRDIAEARNWVGVTAVDVEKVFDLPILQELGVVDVGGDTYRSRLPSVQDYLPLALVAAAASHTRVLAVPVDSYLPSGFNDLLFGELIKREGVLLSDRTPTGSAADCAPELIGFDGLSPFFPAVIVPWARCTVAPDDTHRCVLPAQASQPWRPFLAPLLAAEWEEESRRGARPPDSHNPTECLNLQGGVEKQNPAAQSYLDIPLKVRHRGVFNMHEGEATHEELPQEPTKNQQQNPPAKQDEGDPPATPPVVVDPPAPPKPWGDKECIALIVPTTSRTTNKNKPGMNPPHKLPLLNIFLPSLLKTTDLRRDGGRFHFKMFLGVDVGDPVYDDDLQMSRFDSLWRKQVTPDLSLDYETVSFEGVAGAPAWIWNGLFEHAYHSGCDYFYQVNDDVVIMESGWADDFVDRLKQSPLLANFGIVGPTDVVNPKTMTQTMVHRTHYDIFQTYYPPYFKNWFSDDYLTHVYGAKHTWMLAKHRIRNTNSSGTRYTACTSCKAKLSEKLDTGCVLIKDYLSKLGPDGPGPGDFTCDRSGRWWEQKLI